MYGLKKNGGPLLIVAAGLLWGTMGVFVRYLSALGLTSMQIVAIRVAVTAAVLFPALGAASPKLLRINIRHWWCFFGTGVCSIVMFSYCYFTAITLTSLSVAAVLLYTAPMMVTLLSALLFRETLTPVKAAGCALAFLGCMLVTGVLQSTPAVTPFGIFIGLCSAFGYALYSIFSRLALNRGYHALTITAYTFLFALVGVLPLTHVPTLVSFFAGGGMPVVVAILMGLVTSVMPYVLYTTGLETVEPGRASIMASVEPVTATVVGVMAFGEPLDPYGAAGIALVMGALLLLNRPVATKQTSI